MTDDLALPEAPEPSDGADVELLGLIDRLAELLERSDLSELEIQSGETGVILRKPIAIGAVAASTPSMGGVRVGALWPMALRTAAAARRPPVRMPSQPPARA